eukprot:CAMPEP_0172465342 /NCGR_PEP_ID=MMETSP1065-20121228/53217_1 /TAXON_ID=265537 /ORGANISM="Amphiprora paludosa, Strain CCMP125" /LENGTH=415 /DNA_ID=CAMNT_0013221845 /DNA_START=133 /DNA_END=1380 /DNA_ORIENTATION=-
MPSVADELAALRAKSSVKAQSSKLQNAAGLSTPEAEQSALDQAKQKTRRATYTREASAKLKEGTKAVSQDVDFQMQNIQKKKQDQKAKQEASAQLKQGTKAVSQDVDFQMQNIQKKKQDQKAKQDANAQLQQIRKGGVVVSQDVDFQMQRTAQKKQEYEKKVQADQELKNFNTQNAATSPVRPKATAAAAEDAVPTTQKEPPSLADIDDVDDIPVLEEETPAPAAVTVTDVDADEDDDVPVLEDTTTATTGPRVANRAEKKAKKVMEKLHMRSIPGISRVTIKMQGNGGIYTLVQPDVYEKNGSYICFGEARQGMGAAEQAQQQQEQQQAAQALQQVMEQQQQQPANDGPSIEVIDEDHDTSTTDATTTAVDESGVEAKDIELVMAQAGCSRAKAVTALQDNQGDLVNAIMSLTA